MKRLMIVLTLCALPVALSFLAHAQQPAKIPRIGILAGSSSAGESTRVEAFRQGLRDLGYVEDKKDSDRVSIRGRKIRQASSIG
jgi:putative ABC transport system substrate-binding protein